MLPAWERDGGKIMRLPKRDLIATGLVAVAVLLYLMWAFDAALPGMKGVRASGLAVLALGFAASASAVVPTFLVLLHGNKAYLAVTTLIGSIAVIGGIAALISASGAGLSVVIVAMVLLWIIVTIHHSLLAKRTPRQPRPAISAPPTPHRPPSAIGQ